MDEYLATDEYLKLYETQTEYDAEKDNLQLPNVSLVTENNMVYYNPYEESEVPVISGTDTFTGSTQVTISCETVGATIYYTTDGSNPTLNSAVYTEPITLSATTTVKAISAKANVKSEAASKGFILLVAPVISGSEIFTGSTQVTLSCETAGATIYYTTDGSTPTTESTEYESAITLSADATVKAISAKNGVSSSVTSKAFSVLEAPIISGNTKFEDTTEVTITCDTVGSSIYYTLDGTTPTTSSAEYTAEITLSATTTVKAIAVVGATSSTVASQTFSILDYSREYLTIVSKADNNTIGWKASSSSNLKTISISTDNGSTWTNQASSTAGTALTTLNNGDKLLIKGSNTTYGTSNYYNYFTSTQNFDAEGNIMSLVFGDNFIGESSLSGKNYAFNYLFSNTKLVNAKNLKLPATTLAERCYGYMFEGCTGLTTAPATLPAAALATDCYYNMFQGCTSLTTAPELPATTLANYCYQSMFRDCTSLTAVPATLPATTLAEGCYSSMFQGCTSLTTAPELPATTLAYGCYSRMFNGCTGLTTAPALPATTLSTFCYSYMFSGCTSLTTAPSVLPATTLAQYCYEYMFEGCTSLTTAPALPATTLVNYCYRYMFAGCTSLTTAPELPATTLARSCYYYMFNGCTSLNYIKCLATNISASDCTAFWVRIVAATGTFVKNPNMSGWTTGVSGIPSGWTVENNSPYQAVDLGLPSGTKWANMNVGAASPEDYGEYFSWGNVVGHKPNGTTFDYSFDSTTYDNSSGSNLTGNIPTNATYDAAVANIGGNWRMPTSAETTELCNNTDREWVTNFNGTGVSGYKFMKKTDHSVFIFLPASGYGDLTSLNDVGYYGFYWASSYYDNSRTYCLIFYSSGNSASSGRNYRQSGCSVRAVQSAQS